MKTECISERGKIYIKRFFNNPKKIFKERKKGRANDSEQRRSASD